MGFLKQKEKTKVCIFYTYCVKIYKKLEINHNSFCFKTYAGYTEMKMKAVYFAFFSESVFGSKSIFTTSTLFL